MASNAFNKYMSTDLLRETRTLEGSFADTSQTSRTRSPPPIRPADARTLEWLVVRFGGKVMEALMAADRPLTAKALFERMGDGTVAEFRQALAEMQRRELVEEAGVDPDWGDPCYRAVPPAL
jgi:hypothetical protein